MRSRVARIGVAAIAAEFLVVLTLVLIVAVLGPSDPEAAQAYAERLGYWVGPITGFGFTAIGGWWVARGFTNSHIVNGLLLGVAVAAIDITILALSGTEFQAIFAVSNVGRVVAGSIGGWFAGKSGRKPA